MTTHNTLTEERFIDEHAGHEIHVRAWYDFYHTREKGLTVDCDTCGREIAHIEVDDEPTQSVLAGGDCAVVYEPLPEDAVPLPVVRVAADGDVERFA